MRALRWHGQGDVRLDDVEPPGPPRPGQVQLAVSTCGICGTDVEEWREGPLLIPVGRPHPLTGAMAPLTLGHEVCGEVVAVGEGSGAAVGQLLAVDGLVSCGTCRECRLGRRNLCPRLGQVGLMADGGLQPVVNVPAASCVMMPTGLPPAAGALAETLSVAVRALSRGRMRPGDRVGVFGGGAVGLLAVQTARAFGAGHISLIEPLASRRHLGLGLGADEVFDPDDLETSSRHDHRDDLGFDVVVECSGAPRAVISSIRSARRAGRIVLVGINKAMPPLDTWDVVASEKEIIGSLSHICEQDYAGALALLASGAITYEPLLTQISLEESLEGGLLALADHPERFVKIVVVHDGHGEGRAHV